MATLGNKKWWQKNADNKNAWFGQRVIQVVEYI